MYRRKLRSRVYATWLMALVVCAALLYGALGHAAPATAQSVFVGDMVRYVEQNKPVVAGSRVIFAAKRVAFDGRIVQGPKAQKVDYLYEAFAVVGNEPAPEVRHSMFVEIAEDRVIPVYVERSVADRLAAGVDPRARVRLSGIHLYNYVRGPAIVIDAVVGDAVTALSGEAD